MSVASLLNDVLFLPNSLSQVRKNSRLKNNWLCYTFEINQIAVCKSPQNCNLYCVNKVCIN